MRQGVEDSKKPQIDPNDQQAEEKAREVCKELDSGQEKNDHAYIRLRKRNPEGHRNPAWDWFWYETFIDAVNGVIEIHWGKFTPTQQARIRAICAEKETP